MALPGVLLFAAFLVGVTGWLVGHVRADRLMADAHEAEDTATRLAGAAVTFVATSLAAVPDWQSVALLAPGPSCGPPPAVLAGADEGQEGQWLQATTDTTSRWGADTPRWQLLWRCHAAAVVGRWPDHGAVPAVLVWVADEPEGDQAPLVSINERLLLHAVVVMGDGSRGRASATVGRAAPGAPVTLAAWRARDGA